MSDEMIPISINESFQFSCSDKNTCFNECCRDLNQFLTPYDILRLKNSLGLTSTDFLNQYTIMHIGPETGLPVINFKTTIASDLKCPFVSENGCTVYNDRPASCRTYPLARAISKSRETGEITEYFALIKEDHCKGFSQNQKQTVKEWIGSQELLIYNEMNDLLLEIISKKNQIMPGPLDKSLEKMFYLACYDLDNFRTQIFENNYLEKLNLPDHVLEKIKKDDDELLKLGIKYISYEFFGVQIKY